MATGGCKDSVRVENAVRSRCYGRRNPPSWRYQWARSSGVGLACDGRRVYRAARRPERHRYAASPRSRTTASAPAVERKRRDEREDRGQRRHRPEGEERLSQEGGLRRRSASRQVPRALQAQRAPQVPRPAGVIGRSRFVSRTSRSRRCPPADGAYNTDDVTQDCAAGDKAISAGTGWSPDTDDRELSSSR